MQRNAKNMIGFPVKATDGEVGEVDDFCFDIATWTIRYLVVKTGNWLSNRKVLIATGALGKTDQASRDFSVTISRQQVRYSPDIDTEQNVRREHEITLHEYYRWQPYWTNPFVGGFGILEHPLFESLATETSESENRADPHLRSTRHVTGYHIHATDGEIGHVTDFIINEENWAIESLVVDTRNWLPGKKVLISPSWIMSLDWAAATVYVDRSRDSVKSSPELGVLQKH